MQINPKTKNRPGERSKRLLRIGRGWGISTYTDREIKRKFPDPAKKSERVDNYTSNFYCLQKLTQQGGQCHFSS